MDFIFLSMVTVVIIIVYLIVGLFYATACEVFGEKHHESLFYYLLCKREVKTYIEDEANECRPYCFFILTLVWPIVFTITTLFSIGKWLHNIMFEIHKIMFEKLINLFK